MSEQEPPLEDLSLSTVLAALADPGRLDIVRALAERGEECCNRVGEAARLSVGKSTLSHHLKVLREAGVTRTRAQGTHRYISLRREDLDLAFPRLIDAVLGAPVTVVTTVPIQSSPPGTSGVAAPDAAARRMD